MLGGTFNLSLVTAGYADSGIYECTASNVIGEDSILVRVRVLGESRSVCVIWTRLRWTAEYPFNTIFFYYYLVLGGVECWGLKC